MPRSKLPARPTDVRRAVLDASLALVEEGGVGALSMREVARRARVTHGAPYHYFEDRASILAALAAEGFALLGRELREATEAQPPGTIARFEACGRAYFAFAARHPAHMRIMFRPELAEPASHPEVDVAARAAMRTLIDCVTECQRAGTIAGDDPSPIVLLSWATMHGLTTLWLDGPICRLPEWRLAPEALAQGVASTLGGLLGEPDRRSKSASRR